jgi:hypothetical protein
VIVDRIFIDCNRVADVMRLDLERGVVPRCLEILTTVGNGMHFFFTLSRVIVFVTRLSMFEQVSTSTE